MDAGNRRKEDSGLIDLDALMREANASAAVEESGERPVVQTKKKETLLAPPPAALSAPVSAPRLESTPALVTLVPVAPPRPTSSSRRLVAGIAALAIVGAGLAAYLRGRTLSTPVAAPVVVMTPHEPAAPPPRPLENANDEGRPAAPSANDLPSAVASAAPSSTPSAPAVAKNAAQAKASAAVVTTTELIPESPHQPNDLGRAMNDAVGGGSARVAKTESTQGTSARTLRPSPGAVIGSLNAVLPAARQCLGPDDAVRVGTVTFRSDGSVAKVELNGKRESDDCIRGAVSRARIEPFADDSFTTRVTVRP